MSISPGTWRSRILGDVIRPLLWAETRGKLRRPELLSWAAALEQVAREMRERAEGRG